MFTFPQYKHPARACVYLAQKSETGFGKRVELQTFEGDPPRPRAIREALWGGGDLGVQTEILALLGEVISRCRERFFGCFFLMQACASIKRNRPPSHTCLGSSDGL